MIIRKAKLSEAKEIHNLIMHYAKKEMMLPRSLSELYENIRNYFVCVSKGKVVGCGALAIDWIDLAEIKSLAVHDGYIGKGIGLLLINACAKEAQELGINRVFVLTSIPLFFKKFGFTETSKEDLPKKIWGECAKCPKFPECDEIALQYEITKKRSKKPLLSSKKRTG